MYVCLLTINNWLGVWLERHQRRLDVGESDTADYITSLFDDEENIPVYVIRCVYNFF